MAKPKDKKKDEAPVDGAEGEGEAKPKKGLPIMLIAIAGAAVLVLGGGGAGAYFLFLAPKHPPAAEAGKDAKKAEKKDKKDDKKKDGGADKTDPKTQPVIADGPDGITYFTTPELTANMQSTDGHNAYVKLQVTFEVGDDDTVQLLQDSMPRVNDILQGFMSELRAEDIGGSAGNLMLKQEILRRINLILAPRKIEAVDIKELVST